MLNTHCHPAHVLNSVVALAVCLDCHHGRNPNQTFIFREINYAFTQKMNCFH